MCLQELVEVLPDLGDPLHNLLKVVVPDPDLDLLVHGLPPEVAAKEALHGLHVVGTQHPAEVVVQL